MPSFTINDGKVVSRNLLPLVEVEIVLKKDTKIFAVLTFESVEHMSHSIKCLNEVRTELVFGQKVRGAEQFRMVEVNL